VNPLQAATGEPADEVGARVGEPADGPVAEAGDLVAEAGGKADETVEELCFVARALAQTHPMTEAAHRYRQRCHETERSRQPVTELADWASTALLVGYCLRRAEEQRAGVESAGAGIEPVGAVSDGGEPVGSERARAAGVELAGAGPDGGEPVGSERAGAAGAGLAGAGPDDLALAIAAAAESLRAGKAERVTLLDPDATISALDRVIATELDKRREHLREQLDDQEWSELEDYIAWWTVHGYALRAVEFP